MPHSLPYNSSNITLNMSYGRSRDLTAEEWDDCARWFADQMFLDRVCEDCGLALPGHKFMAAGWFQDRRDLTLFKLTWG